MQHEAKASGKVGLPYLLVVRKVTKDNHTDKGVEKLAVSFLPYRPDTVLHLHLWRRVPESCSTHYTPGGHTVNSW
jgi:hypothetical protein